MTTFVQLHLLTAYPPANLNRDDTGSPKTAVFGGKTRLRISSQALKRAWRTSDVFASALDGHLGKRTQRLGREVRLHLLGRGADEKKAIEIARQVADLFGKVRPEKDAEPDRIEQLAFISPAEKEAALALADRLLDGKAPEKLAPDLVLHEADGAVDIAMFGRMLADDPHFNREAAVQVAHAITVHASVVEDDYYTAVDDLKTASEDAGAGFVGEAGYGAGVFYLYACIDTDLLVRNLGGDAALAKRGVAALIAAAATVAPKGKQASFASRAHASLVMAERGSAAPRTLASAFLKPIDGTDMMAEAAAQLAKTRDAFARAYGDAPHAETMNILAADGPTLAEVIAFATGW